jgi:hypothetical protein
MIKVQSLFYCMRTVEEFKGRLVVVQTEFVFRDALTLDQRLGEHELASC